MHEQEFSNAVPRSRSRRIDGTPSASFSYNILYPNKTIDIGPMACLREPGHLHNTAKSAVRALDVIELLAQNGGPLRAYEIVRAIGLSPSSADQLLKTLVDTAYLLFDPCTKEYHLSPRMSQIGAAMQRGFFDGDHIDAIMRRILQSTREAVTLLAPQGQFMQIVDFREDIPSRRLPRLPIGTRMPLFGSCSGAAWLAEQTDDRIRTLITRSQRELGPLAQDQDLILESIHRVREQGFAVGGFQLSERSNVRGIAVALPPSSSKVTLVVTAVVDEAELANRQDKVLSDLRNAIDQPR